MEIPTSFTQFYLNPELASNNIIEQSPVPQSPKITFIIWLVNFSCLHILSSSCLQNYEKFLEKNEWLLLLWTNSAVKNFQCIKMPLLTCLRQEFFFLAFYNTIINAEWNEITDVIAAVLLSYQRCGRHFW